MIAAAVKYKKSGIDWLEEIPEHWKVVRLKNIVEINARKLSEQTSKNALINYIDITNVNGDGDILEVQLIKFKDAPSRARRVLKKNDTIISTVRTYLKAITAIREDNFIGSTGFAVLTPDADKLNPDYLYYYVSSKAFVNKVMVNSVGVAYPAITPTTLACLPFILPPIEEQNIIVNILNSESTKITRFIQTKQRFIELLKEQRQSIITNAVTKGIDEDVKMKETGVDWIPQIPESWKKRRLRFLVKITTGKKNTEDRVDDGEYPFYVRSQTIERINSFSFNGEGILTAGDGVGVGKVFHYVNSKFDFHQRVYLFYDIHEELEGEFLFNYLQANMMSELMRYNSKSTVDSIRLPVIKNFLVVFPEREQQKRILEHIKTETRTLDIAISKAEREIELIKEYREAMIAEAVTGKMKL